MSLAPEHSRKKKLRVVIADDSASLRGMLSQLCERLPGLEVVGEAQDGVQAVNLVHDLQPDVLILDLKMPRLGGLEVLQAIHAGPTTPLILIWTGLPMEMFGERWRTLGAHHYFLKGLQMKELTQTLRALGADAGH